MAKIRPWKVEQDENCLMLNVRLIKVDLKEDFVEDFTGGNVSEEN